MAEDSLPELRTFLEDNYNTPSNGWTAGLSQQFAKLQKALETGANTLSQPDSDNDKNSPSAARAAALPVIKLIHLNSLIATDGALACGAFGTVSQDTFEDLFWEEIEGDGKDADRVEVYEAKTGSFQFRFGEYKFNLNYFQWSDLVRQHPDILSASEEIVAMRTGDRAAVAVRSAQSFHKLYDHLSSKLGSEVVNSAFYYLRAWAIERGLWDNPCLPRNKVALSTYGILTLMDDSAQEVSTLVAGVLKAVINDESPFVIENRLCRGELPESAWTSMFLLLKTVRALPLELKMNMPLILKVEVEYSGSSSIAGGKLLATVERHMEKLHKSISTVRRCAVWPTRLVPMSSRSLGQSCYMIGISVTELDLNPETRSSIEQRALDWETNIRRHETEGFNSTSCYLETALFNVPDMKETFVMNTREWKRETIPSKRRDKPDDHESHKFIAKKEEKSETSSNEPSKKLERASKILSRLQHDSSYDIDEFKVGYLDRFKDDIQEKAAAAWKKDETHEEFIPEHRIEYFKRYPQHGVPEIIWEKKTKTDRVFWSGNSIR